MIALSKATLKEALEIHTLETKAYGEEVTSRYGIPLMIKFGFSFVAKEEGKIVGFILAQVTKEDCLLVDDIVVDSDYQRRGIALKLYRHLLEETKNKDILALVDSCNTPSLEMHHKLGFIKVEKLSDFYGRGTGEFILLRLRRGLFSR